MWTYAFWVSSFLRHFSFRNEVRRGIGSMTVYRCKLVGAGAASGKNSVVLQVAVKPMGTGAIFWPKSGKCKWFTKLVLGME